MERSFERHEIPTRVERISNFHTLDEILTVFG